MKKTLFIFYYFSNIYSNILNNLGNNKFLYLITHIIGINKVNNCYTYEINYKTHFPFLGVSVPYSNDVYLKINDIKPERIIVMDIITSVFWQAFYYKIKNKKVELILYSEVQRYPKNLFLKLIFFFIFFIFKFFIAKKVSKIICFTIDGVEFYKKLLPKKINDIHLLSAVINTTIFYPLKKRKYLVNDKLKLLIIARMVYYKNYYDLLKSLKYLKKNHPNLNFSLSILGDGPLKEKIIKKIKEYNLDKEVIFLNKIPNNKISKYYYEHDVLILPSFNEAIGMVVPEAMSCATPVIISDTIGAKTYVQNNINGLIFKTGDYLDLANKILEMNDRKKLERYGKNGAKYIKKYFSLKMVKSYFRKIM